MPMPLANHNQSKADDYPSAHNMSISMLNRNLKHTKPNVTAAMTCSCMLNHMHFVRCISLSNSCVVQGSRDDVSERPTCDSIYEDDISAGQHLVGVLSLINAIDGLGHSINGRRD